MHWEDAKMLTEKSPICEVVQRYPLLAGYLQRWGMTEEQLSACVPLEEVLNAIGLPFTTLLQHLALHQTGSTYDAAVFSGLSAVDMIGVLRREHHDFLVKRLPRFSLILKELCERKGEEQPNLLDLRDAFERFRADISEHILQEQDSLYTYIEQLQAFLWGELSTPEVRALLALPSPCHHALRDDEDEAFFVQLRIITDNYALPADAGIMQRTLYKELQQLEQDLLRHEAVELELLLGRVVQLEDEVHHRLQAV